MGTNNQRCEASDISGGGITPPSSKRNIKMKSADLMEQRAGIVDRMNAAHEKDDNAAFETAETELRNIDSKLDRQRKIDAADRSEPGTPINGDSKPDRKSRV